MVDRLSWLERPEGIREGRRFDPDTLHKLYKNKPISSVGWRVPECFQEVVGSTLILQQHKYSNVQA